MARRVIHQRLCSSSRRGWAGHPHPPRPVSDIRRPETETDDYFAITAEGPFRDRNATFLGKYTDRDQQMRAPGDRGCEYVALYETSGAEFTGGLQQ